MNDEYRCNRDPACRWGGHSVRCLEDNSLRAGVPVKPTYEELELALASLGSRNADLEAGYSSSTRREMASETRALAAEATIAQARERADRLHAWIDTHRTLVLREKGLAVSGELQAALGSAPTAAFDAALAEARAGGLEEDVAAERARQMARGYTTEHDDEHGHWALAGVAMSYESRGRLLEALAVLRAAREAFDRARDKQEESSTTNGEPA